MDMLNNVKILYQVIQLYVLFSSDTWTPYLKKCDEFNWVQA